MYEIERNNERVGEMDHASYLEKNEGCELEPKCHPTYIHGEVVGFYIIYLYLIYAIFYILALAKFEQMVENTLNTLLLPTFTFHGLYVLCNPFYFYF